MLKLPIDQLLDAVEWTALPPPSRDEALPYATHSGVLAIGEVRLKVYQLNTGERVIDGDDLADFFGAESLTP